MSYNLLRAAAVAIGITGLSSAASAGENSSYFQRAECLTRVLNQASINGLPVKNISTAIKQSGSQTAVSIHAETDASTPDGKEGGSFSVSISPSQTGVGDRFFFASHSPQKDISYGQRDPRSVWVVYAREGTHLFADRLVNEGSPLTDSQSEQSAENAQNAYDEVIDEAQLCFQ